MKYFYMLVLGLLFCSCAKEAKEFHTIDFRDSASDKHYIYGFLSFKNDKVKVNSVEVDYKEGMGQNIYFNDLQSVIISQCIKEQAANNVLYNDSLGTFSCYNTGVQEIAWLQVESYHVNGLYSYKDFVCSQALYSCVGYKFLELSEIQDIIFIEGEGVEPDAYAVPFAKENHFDKYLKWV